MPVIAIMLAPDDQRARKDFIELARAEVLVKGLRTLAADGTIALSPLESRILKSAEIFQKYSTSNPGTRFLHGLMAGAVLGFVLGCKEAPRLKRHASVGAAIRALSDSSLRGTGKENFRQRVWRTYRPVSHLWAAFGGFGFRGWDHGLAETDRLVDLTFWVANRADRKGVTLPAFNWLAPRLEACQARFEEFLALSEILRRHGECWTPPHGRMPVLDRDECWRLSDDHPALALIPRIECALTFEPHDGLIAKS